MSALIESVLVQSGLSVYAIIRDYLGQVWNGSTFEAYNSANWATYDVPLSEQAGSGYYSASFPSSISAGKYSFVIHSGGTPTVGDPVLDRGAMDWNGSGESSIGLIIVKLPPGQISGFDPTSQNVNLNSNQASVTIGTANALGASATSTVKTQIDTALGTDTIPELTGVPASTTTLKKALMFLYMALRNKRTTDASTVKVYNSSGGVIATAGRSDNGTTGTKEVFS